MKWNTGLYDKDHSYVHEYGNELIPLLEPKRDEWILDLGSGTGDLTSRISSSGANVIGIDSSVEMINQARQKYPGLQFLQMDARNLQLPRPVDGIFSNAALHWIREAQHVVRAMYANLHTPGRLVVEFGGKGNVADMISALRRSLVRHGYIRNADLEFWFFPSISEYASILEKEGFSVTQAWLFDRPTPLAGASGLINWFRMFAAPYLEGIDPGQQEIILSESQESLKETHLISGTWYADYRRLRIVAVK